MNKQMKKRVEKYAELFALAMALSAVIVITFYLITLYEHPIIFTEPIVSIRVWEIVCGFITIPVLIKLMWNRLYE